MSNGRDLLAMLDSDLLEYSNNLDGPEQAVNAWRALCNLQERVSLLALHAARQGARHDSAAAQFDNVRRALSGIETDLQAVLQTMRPDDNALRATTDAHEAATARNAGEEALHADILRGFVANGGQLELAAGDSSLDPILRGFHPGEVNGRWSGPFTTSAILLPLQKLRRAGVGMVRLRMNLTQLYDITEFRILFGADLAEDAAPVRVGSTEIVVDIDALETDADRLVINCKRTRHIGDDKRLLGFMLGKIILEHAHVG